MTMVGKGGGMVAVAAVVVFSCWIVVQAATIRNAVSSYVCLTVLFLFLCLSVFLDRLVGLVVKASASRAENPGFESRLHRDFFGVGSYQ